MERLLLTLGAIIAIQILSVALIGNIRKIPKHQFTAEEVIACRGMNPDLHKKIMDDTIVDYTRDEDIEKEYKELREIFKNKLQSKELSHGQLIGIEQYLRDNLSIKKQYKNNAHAIYSMLKMPNLTTNHISTIKNFIYK